HTHGHTTSWPGISVSAKVIYRQTLSRAAWSAQNRIIRARPPQRTTRQQGDPNRSGAVVTYSFHSGSSGPEAVLKSGGGFAPPRSPPGTDAQALGRSDGVQHLSAVHQRILRLERVGEPVELPEPGIGVVLAVLGVTGNLDGDDVLGDVITPVGAEGGTEYPGAEEGAARLVLAPARQLPLGEQPIVFRTR